MAEPREPRDPSDALSRAATFAVRPIPSAAGSDNEPEADSTAHPAFDGEDFLYHLYRGSELLQDSYIEEAKEELERALRMQPRDIEGQGLLGVVYFRLGLYPRAIEIYEEIIRAVPNDITPRVNLGLCYIKTGQHVPAREVLEEVIVRDPQHLRGWGYLGLVFERLGEYEKAQAAFEKAAQPHLARRMQLILEELRTSPSEPPPEQDEMRRAAADAVEELDAEEAAPFSHADSRVAAEPPRAGRWRAHEPGQETVPPRSQPPRRPSLVGRFGPAVPSVPPPEELSEPPPAHASLPPSSLVHAAALEPPTQGRTAVHHGAVVIVRVEVGIAVRHSALVALSHDEKPFKRAPVLRRSRGRETEEAFGGGAGWSLLEGTGFLTLSAQHERTITLLDLKGEFVYLREGAVLGFDASLRYENGRLPGSANDPVPMVQFSGQGLLILESESPPSSVLVSGERPLVLRADRVLGWTGRLLAHPVEPDASPTHTVGFVTFTGDGAVLLDVG
ncbi:MAG TPA: tetratricopeptide repeat protein [Polyangiaceae bacterium]|jgi:hypothetical protein|nr:tetratricopeptide repeat protein [Polyangiaceae bacterium]